MVRLTDRPDMTLAVNRGRKTTTQQQISRTGRQTVGNYFIHLINVDLAQNGIFSAKVGDFRQGRYKN